jgi:hypothetical protein
MSAPRREGRHSCGPICVVPLARQPRRQLFARLADLNSRMSAYRTSAWIIVLSCSPELDVRRNDMPGIPSRNSPAKTPRLLRRFARTLPAASVVCSQQRTCLQPHTFGSAGSLRVRCGYFRMLECVRGTTSSPDQTLTIMNCTLGAAAIPAASIIFHLLCDSRWLR